MAADASDGSTSDSMIDIRPVTCQYQAMLTVRFGPDGRVLVPVELRRSLGVVPGEPFAARVDDGRLVIERRADAVARVQARFSVIPKGVSLVDELLADRRRDVEQDTP